MSCALKTDRAVVGVFGSRSEAEAAITSIKEQGISVEDISVITGDTPERDAALGREHPPVYVELGMEHACERIGAVMGSIYGTLIGIGSIFITGIGLLIVMGPLAGFVAGAAGGAILGGAFGRASFGEFAAEYRTHLLKGDWLVMIHCDLGEEARVAGIMEAAGPNPAD